MTRKRYYIGMDVHKDFVQIAVYEGNGGEPISERRLVNDPSLLVKELKKITIKGPTEAAYEAGCTGYVLQRALVKGGIPCYILPANKVAKKREDQIKTDKRDARLIARELRNKSIRPISVPDEEDEAARDVIRCREDVNEDLRRAKQRLTKFLLRHGHTYDDEGGNWTIKHWKWMDSITFNQAHEVVVYEEYRSQIRGLEERESRLEREIVEIAESPRYKEAVNKLRAFKGIDYIIGVALICEIGDYKRFGNAKAFMSYLGFVPKENSSGGRRNQGGITKAGNGHLRRLLVEAAWHYTRNDRLGKRLEQRRMNSPIEALDAADRALKRLHRKYLHLVMGGKHKNKAITAIARELSGFIWAVQVSA